MLLVKSLSSIKRKNILLVTHAGADVDAICAAAALLFPLRKSNKAQIFVPNHIGIPAKKLAKKLEIPFKVVKKASLKEFDCLFLVDFNDLQMAGGLESSISSFKGEIFLVDHHQLTRKKITSQKNTLADPNAVASCELVFDWLKKSGIKIDKKMATCLAAGLVTDSAYFLVATSKTFAIMSEMLAKSGKSFSGLLSIFSVPRTFDEKIAKLKAAKRARIFLVSGYIVVTSDVGAFESDAASALVKIGADIAFVGDTEDNKLRISGRASQQIVKKENFGLANNVFQKLPTYFGGSGGGHPGAAGFNGKGKNINEALQKCLALTKQFFRKKKGFRFKEYT